MSVLQKQNQASLWAVVLWEKQPQNHGQCFHPTLSSHISSHSRTPLSCVCMNRVGAEPLICQRVAQTEKNNEILFTDIHLTCHRKSSQCCIRNNWYCGQLRCYKTKIFSLPSTFSISIVQQDVLLRMPLRNILPYLGTVA